MGSQPQEILRNEGSEYTLSESNAYAAWARIGGTSAHFVRRVLYWVNQSPNAMTQEDWTNLRAEIGVLGSIFFCSPLASDHFFQHQISSPSVNVFYPMPTMEGAKHFLTTLTSCMKDISERSIAKVGPLTVTFCISRGKPTKKGRKLPPNIPHRENTIDEAIYRIIEALQACGALVNQCNDCKRYFLADRINQIFCSSTCLNRVTTRRSREEKKKKELEKELAAQKKKRSKTKKPAGKIK